MKVTRYHKLVRDKIPDIIEQSGRQCEIETLSKKEYIKALDAKLDEELAEYQESKSLEELADLLEVIRAVAVARGFSLEELERIRLQKAAERGGFEKQIMLKRVYSGTQTERIEDQIIQHKDQILKKLDKETLLKYCWIQTHVQKCNVATDVEFQRKFSGYYRMRFVPAEYRKRFFELFEQIKSVGASFEETSRMLYKVSNRHEFSFITKMLHTINPTLPIYDSQVHASLELRRDRFLPDLGKQIAQDVKVLRTISLHYKRLMETPAVQELSSKIDKRVFPYAISEEKKVDFILWALGSVSNND